jgi:hypothetical protein
MASLLVMKRERSSGSAVSHVLLKKASAKRLLCERGFLVQLCEARVINDFKNIIFACCSAPIGAQDMASAPRHWVQLCRRCHNCRSNRLPDRPYPVCLAGRVFHRARLVESIAQRALSRMSAVQQACVSAWGPGADRHSNRLIDFISMESML